MRRARGIPALLGAFGLASAAGCTTTYISDSSSPSYEKKDDVYYSRGAYRDAYPPAGMPGSPIRYGRPYYY